MFRFEPEREIFWVHKEHIAQQFLRVCTTDTTEVRLRGLAAGQTALCYATGFGVSTNWDEADKYFSQARELGCHVARAFQELLYQRGVRHSGKEYTGVLCDILSLENISPISAGWLNEPRARQTKSTTNIVALPSYTVKDLIPELENAIRRKDCREILAIHEKSQLDTIFSIEPPLIQGLRTRNWEVVQTLLNCGLSPETKDRSGRNVFHWLFMLDEDAPRFASYCRTKFDNIGGLEDAVYTTITPHSQWPTQLQATPLAHAITTGSYNTVIALLSLGADPLVYIAHAGSQESWTAIHLAVKYHRPDILTALLEAIDNRQYKTLFMLPPMMALCYSSVLERIAMHGKNARKHLDETIALLDRSKSLEMVSMTEITPLMRPIQSIDVQVVTALLQRNAAFASIRSTSPDQPDHLVATHAETLHYPIHHGTFHYPIHHASQIVSSSENLEALKILEMVTRYDPSALSRLDSHDQTPLHLAAAGISTRAVAFLLKATPSLLNTRDAYGAIPLHYCESAKVVGHLVSSGADVNAVDYSGKSALLYATAKELCAVVKTLCQLKANTDMCERSEHNPLHLAVKNNFQDITATLVAVGASINNADHLGNTPLHIAARRSPRHVLELLIGNGANSLILNDRGLSPLHIAAQFDHYDAVDMITHFNSETILKSEMEKDSSGQQVIQSLQRSPLFVCLERSNIKAARLMLARLPRMDIEKKDQTGRNILHYLAEEGNSYLVESLICRQVNLNARTNRGDTALMLAIRSPPKGEKRLNICRILVQHGPSVTAQNDAGETAWDIAVNNIDDESQDDIRFILTLLLRHSEEACRKITWEKNGVRESCGGHLVHFAFNRPDPQLIAALEIRMPSIDFNVAMEDEKNKKREQEEKIQREKEEMKKREIEERKRNMERFPLLYNKVIRVKEREKQIEEQEKED
jgi:ankyrin repeat protein